MNASTILPPFLSQGDAVALVATARFVDRAIVNSATRFFEKQGFVVKCYDGLFSRHNQFAGTDEQRADLVNQAFRDAEVKALICLRGGYGTIRILEYLDKEQFLSTPKWIVGYSDVTVLHAWCNSMNVASLHASMPVNFETNTAESLSRIANCLAGRIDPIQTSGPNIQVGTCDGVLRGGNLSVLYSMSGSDLFCPQPDTILFLEDLDEYLYHVDRMMMNLQVGGWTKSIRGLIVGGMSDMRDNTVKFGFKTDNPFGQDVKEIIAGHSAKWNIPVCWGFPSGHLDHNLPLVMNAKVHLEVNESDALLSWKSL